MWKCLAISLAVLSLWNTAHCHQEEIPIGVILEEGYEYLKWALTLSVDRINSDPLLLQGTKLRPKVQVIPKDDAYSAMAIACEWIKEGIAAIFGPQSLRATASVQAVAESAGIPVIPGRWEYRNYNSSTTVYFYPHADTKGHALKGFIGDRKWRRMVMLYSDVNAFMRLNPMLLDDPNIGNMSTAAYEKPEVRMERVNDLSDYKKVLKDMKMKNYKNFLIDCPTDHIYDILNQAQEMSMLSMYHNYLFTSLDAHVVDLSKFQPYNCNITTFRVVIFEGNEEYQKVYKNLEENPSFIGIQDQVKSFLNRTQFAIMYDAVLHFAHSLEKLTSGMYLKVQPMECYSQKSWKQGKIIVDSMKQIHSEGLSGYIHLDDKGYRTDFQLMESRLTPLEMKVATRWNETIERYGIPVNLQYYAVYSLNPRAFGGHANCHQEEGKWNGTVFLSLRNYSEETREAVELLTRKKLIVCSVCAEPYFMANKDPDGPKYVGHAVDLVAELASRANFTFEFKEVSDGQYGKKSAEGEWNGMIGELLREEADMIVADFTITPDRQNVVDFTYPFMDLGIGILFKKPDQKEENLFSFMSSFSTGVWFYMATAALGVTLVMYAMGRFTPYEWLSPHPCDEEPEELENQFTLSETAWVVAGCLLQQGGDIEPKATSTRMASGFWWFFTLIMVSSYTANLTAFLTAGRMEDEIKSAEDLAAQQKIQYGCYKGGATERFFMGSKAPLISKMWSAMESAEPSVLMESNKAGIKRVLMGNYAHFMESSSIEYQLSKDCRLTMVGGRLDNKHYGIAVPQGSIVREMLSYHLLKMQETGVNNILKDRWWKKGLCPPKAESSDTLGLENLGGVFLILLIGLPVACFIVIFEFFWEARKIPRDKREPLCKELYKEFKATVTGKNTTKQAPSEEDDEEKMLSKRSSSSSSSSSPSSTHTSQTTSKDTSKVSKKSQ